MTAGTKTLKEIAEAADVSPSLVSRILRGKGRASEPVRKRVTALLEQAGYQPRRTDRPAVMLIDLPRITAGGKAGPILAMIEGIQHVLLAEEVGLSMEFVPEAPAAADEQVRTICDRRPGGLLVPTDTPWLARAARLAGEASVPLVQVGYDTENPRYPAAVVDSFTGAYEAVSFLLARGHRRIATVRWMAGDITNSAKKHAGYQAALASAELPVDEALVVTVDALQHEPGWVSPRALVERLTRLADPPTAVFVENSFLSPPLLYPGPGDAGALPERIAALDMVHFEDWPLDPAEDLLAGKLGFPPRQTTVVRIDWDAIGRTAARLLAENMRNTDDAHRRIVRVSPVLQRVAAQRRRTTYAPSTPGDTP